MGSRGTFANMTKATFGAMLLSGLWHGASWTFVLWGAYHATLLTLYRIIGRRIPKGIRKSMPGHIAAVALMFVFTVVGWLIFRETDIGQLMHFFTLNPFEGTPDEFLAASIVMSMALCCSVPLVLALIFQEKVLPRIEQQRWFLPARTTFWGILALSIFIMSRSTSNDFIYFQF